MPIPVTDKISTTAPGDTYATHEDSLGQGGLQTVATLADRNNISTARRKFGMLVTVNADPTPANNKTYRLCNTALGGSNDTITDNANWLEFSSGSSSYQNPTARTIYVFADSSDVTKFGGSSENAYNTWQAGYNAAVTLQTALGGSEKVTLLFGNITATQAGDLTLTSALNSNIIFEGLSRGISQLGNIIATNAGGAGRAVVGTFNNLKIGNIDTTGTTSGGVVTITGNAEIGNITTSCSSSGAGGAITLNGALKVGNCLSVGATNGAGGAFVFNGEGAGILTSVITRGNGTGDGGAITISENVIINGDISSESLGTRSGGTIILRNIIQTTGTITQDNRSTGGTGRTVTIENSYIFNFRKRQFGATIIGGTLTMQGIVVVNGTFELSSDNTTSAQFGNTTLTNVSILGTSSITQGSSSNTSGSFTANDCDFIGNFTYTCNRSSGSISYALKSFSSNFFSTVSLNGDTNVTQTIEFNGGFINNFTTTLTNTATQASINHFPILFKSVRIGNTTNAIGIQITGTATNVKSNTISMQGCSMLNNIDADYYGSTNGFDFIKTDGKNISINITNDASNFTFVGRDINFDVFSFDGLVPASPIVITNGSFIGEFQTVNAIGITSDDSTEFALIDYTLTTLINKIFEQEFIIASADVLQLFTTPFTLASIAFGQPYIISAEAEMSNSTTPYDTNTILNIGYASGGPYPVTHSSVLATTSGAYFSSNYNSYQVYNEDLILVAETGDPLNGDGDLVLKAKIFIKP